MTHHLVNLPLDFLSQTKNILLIRNPKDVLISYSKVIEQTKLDDIGIKQNYDLYLYLKENNFHSFIRIHRSFAVQKQFIKKILVAEVQLNNDVIIPVGRSFKDNLKSLA